MQKRQMPSSILLMVTAIVLAGPVTAAATTRGMAVAVSPHTRPQLRPAAGGTGSGDVPDNAVYLRFKSASFSIDYIEGWLQTTVAHGMIFNDKDSAVAVDLRGQWRGALATYVQRVDLPHLAHAAGFVRGPLSRDTIAGATTIHLSYRSHSAADPVTSKVVTLQNDRYYVGGAHSLAVLTLSTPLGVDNVDAFHRIAHSFSFR